MRFAVYDKSYRQPDPVTLLGNIDLPLHIGGRIILGKLRILRARADHYSTGPQSVTVEFWSEFIAADDDLHDECVLYTTAALADLQHVLGFTRDIP